jgi:hypothetical protein
MRARMIWLMATSTIVLLGVSPPGQAQAPTNLLTNNSGFETGAITGWGSYGALATFTVVKDCVGAAVPEGPIEGNYCLNVKVTGAGANRWDAAFQAPMATPPGAIFQKGKTYTFSIFLKSKSGTAQVFISPELSQDPYTAYGAMAFTTTDKWVEYHLTTPVIPADVNPAHLTIHVAYAAQEFWADDAKWYEGAYVPTVTKNKLSALSPTPENNATDVARNPTLSWKAGPFANTHDVYLGTSFEDVNKADVSQAASQGQTETAFEPASPLAYGTTYYWRVDEVNAPPSNTVFKGDIWSFTVEPYAYTLTGVTVTASSSYTATGQTAAKTIDGSGLSADGLLHSNADTDGWLTDKNTVLPAWIQYDFDQPRLIQQMKVWNSNQKLESLVGLGAKSVLIEYSLDGTTWETLKTEEFPQADGADAYAGFAVDMGGLYAKSIRLTIQSNWSPYGLPQTGLSEVRFLYIPVQARLPDPATDSTGVPVGTGFDWREGRMAASHEVYFGTDEAALALVDTTSDHRYQPPSLDFGTLYYWRVDEVNNAPASDWAGNVWSFVTAEYGDIDNFESYTNESPHRVFQTWIDGYGFSPDDFFPAGNLGNGTGSLVGYDPTLGDIMETSIVHGGGKSMPVEYNNVNSPYYSEVDRTWSTPQNWTTHGATDLSLWFRGNPAAFLETASGMTVSGAGADIYQGTDEFRLVYKKLTGDGSITVRVDSAQTVNDWTKTGVMIRENLGPLAMQVHMISAAQQSLVEWMYRSIAGSATTTALTTAANSNPLPVWLRLTRAGNVFTGEYSTNGTTWTKITGTDGTTSSTTILMPTSVYVGLVVCGHSGTDLAVADFSQIKTTANVTGAWQVADVGVAQPANTPDTLYVTLVDGQNKSKTLVHPDAQATCAADWTQWLIPLTDLSPVNPAAIQKMTIGIGSRSSPKAGAAGHIFIDDIQYGAPIPPLVAHYAFDGDATDSSGNGHDGTLVGGPTFVAGAKGQAVQFSGAVGPFVDLGTFNPSALTGKLTVALWANWKGPTGLYQGLMAKRDWWDPPSGNMWQIEANNAAGAVTFSRNGSYPGSGNPILPVNEWAHVAVTFDGTTARFYVNGTQTGSGAFSFGPNREASMHVGCCDSNGGNPFNGAIDDVGLYNQALSVAEVKALATK